MLRGFWLAMAVLAVMEMGASTLLLPSVQQPLWMFASAWGAAALFAVGAAVTLFSAEREEETYGFLLQLPARWPPLFWAKVITAAGSSLALAVVLCGIGFSLAGSAWPSTTQDALLLGIVAVFEATT